MLDVGVLHWMVAEDATLAAEGSMSPLLSVGFRYLVHLFALFTVQFSVNLPAGNYLDWRLWYFMTQCPFASCWWNLSNSGGQGF